jgi:tetratricopeptide (TPR) repeat protein
MRARAGLAGRLWQRGEREAAVEHYREMLRLNPNDNQGIRYLLATCLIEIDRDDELAALLKQYDGDAMAAWAYAKALLAFRREGDSPRARRLLRDAMKTNPHVPARLLLQKKPKRLPEFIGFGDENEAIAYVAENLEGWKRTPGALAWLARHV